MLTEKLESTGNVETSEKQAEMGGSEATTGATKTSVGKKTCKLIHVKCLYFLLFCNLVQLIPRLGQPENSKLLFLSHSASLHALYPYFAGKARQLMFHFE